MSTDFLERVLKRVGGRRTVREYVFQHWREPGKPTDETVGLLPVPGVDAERFLDRVMDVDGYLSNIGYVVESRVIPDPLYRPPEKVRFYQRVKIPVLGEVHQENVLERRGELGGFEVASWYMLERETEALGGKRAIRSQYSDGAWLVGEGVVGYALSTAPRRDDVGLIKWKALTTGANLTASKVIRENIEAMARWAERSRQGPLGEGL
jgi:hypothetical protein